MRIDESNLDKINDEQKQFVSDLLQWRPDFKKFCTAELSTDGQYNLRVEIPSPTGEKERDIFIWISDGRVSLEFGLWHTHSRAMFETDQKGVYETYTILELAQMIIANEFVYFVEIGAEKPFPGVLCLRHKHAVETELTSKYSTGDIFIKSWDGTQDRRVTLKDLTL